MGRDHLAIGLFAFLLALALSSRASAEVGEEIERARELFRSFEYDEAVGLLEAAVGDESATARQRVTALEIIGSIQVLQDNPEQAERAFQRLLDLDPGHEVSDPDLPPRVREAFEATRDNYAPSLDLDVDLSIPSEPAGEAVTARATISGGGGVAEAVLFVREAGEGSFQSLFMTREGRAFTVEVTLPAAEEQLEYYLELRAPSGHVLGGVASSIEPHALTAVAPRPTDEPIEEPTRRPFYRTWWFWTIIGVVVVGGVTAGVVAGTRPEEHQDGTLGSVQMPLVRF